MVLAEASISAGGAITSKAKTSAPASCKSLILSGLRAVAMTLWPRFKAESAISLPNPELAAVMNHTGVGSAMVTFCLKDVESLLYTRRDSWVEEEYFRDMVLWPCT